jgi:hypothetical protein
MWAPSRLNKARHQQASACGRSLQCGWMQVLLLPCLPRPERISTNPPALEAVIAFLQKSGRPRQMTFDRDPLRWVGGVSGRDFPSPLRRLLLCLGMRPHVCPPHRPDKNAFVMV